MGGKWESGVDNRRSIRDVRRGMALVQRRGAQQFAAAAGKEIFAQYVLKTLNSFDNCIEIPDNY